MTASRLIGRFVAELIACDQQPSTERLTEFRQALEHKVTGMKNKGRGAQWVCLVGVVVMLLGLVVTIIASGRQPSIHWLTVTGFSLAVGGAIVIVVGSVGLFLYRGFGYVWARHDLQEAAIWELSAQVQRLSQQIDEIRKSTA